MWMVWLFTIHEWHDENRVHWTKNNEYHSFFLLHYKIRVVVPFGCNIILTHIRQWNIDLRIYLRHPSKMDRHHVYSATILPRLLSNTSLQCAIHWNDPANIPKHKSRIYYCYSAFQWVFNRIFGLIECISCLHMPFLTWNWPFIVVSKSTFVMVFFSLSPNRF